jgi:hypothetical protein
MDITFYLACFFGGAFFINGIPHLVSGLQGRAFPTPFSTPRGVGKSPAVGNVIWGFFNFLVAYFLLFKVTHFQIELVADVVVTSLGAFLLAVYLAYRFAQVNASS